MAKKKKLKSKRAKPIKIESSSLSRKKQTKEKFVWIPTVFREDYPNTPKGTKKYTNDRKKLGSGNKKIVRNAEKLALSGNKVMAKSGAKNMLKIIVSI